MRTRWIVAGAAALGMVSALKVADGQSWGYEYTIERRPVLSLSTSSVQCQTTSITFLNSGG